jgi:hypothetical protein
MLPFLVELYRARKRDAPHAAAISIFSEHRDALAIDRERFGVAFWTRRELQIPRASAQDAAGYLNSDPRLLGKTLPPTRSEH